MLPKDMEYYRRRAVAERERALNSASPEIAAIHEELAQEYENRAQSDEPHGMLRAV